MLSNKHKWSEIMVAYKSHGMQWVAVLGLLLFINSAMAGGGYRISGPYTQNNLSVFLIHGEDRVKNQKFLTLGEAMRTRKVKVYETSNVNQLSIENLSKTENIYIQAGDIVKGGKQDRVFSTDMVLEPGSGKINIASFCVEQSRWSKRGKESSRVFNSSTKNLSSKGLRLAARLKSNQSEVWAKVSEAQRKLSKSVGHSVRSRKSASSLQLTLENKKLVAKVSAYKAKLLPLLRSKKKVIGYAFSINGKLNTADIYANTNLFRKLWPKIIDAASTEAVAEYNAKLSFKAPKPEAIQHWMSKANKGKARTKTLKKGLSQDIVESKSDVRFDTYSGIGKSKSLYRQNYIKK